MSEPVDRPGGPPLAHAFWVREPGEGEIRTFPLPPGPPGAVTVRARWSGISRGTESLVFRGEVPPSLYARMRAPFQTGAFPAPVSYGYSSVGEVEDPGDSSLVAGTPVFCLYPHQDRYRVPADALVPLPPGVPPERAILAANMETALNGVWDGNAGPGDRIVVVGAGVVGLLVAWLSARIPGTRVVAVDTNPARAAVAEALGVAFARPGQVDRAAADLVFHASGTGSGAAEALEVAGEEATVVELSWYGTRSVHLPLGEGFHPRRLTLRSSQVGSLPPLRQPRWNHRRRMGVALDLLAAPELDRLITGESPFLALPAVMARLSQDPGDTLCHRIHYP